MEWFTVALLLMFWLFRACVITLMMKAVVIVMMHEYLKELEERPSLIELSLPAKFLLSEFFRTLLLPFSGSRRVGHGTVKLSQGLLYLKVSETEDELLPYLNTVVYVSPTSSSKYGGKYLVKYEDRLVAKDKL